MESNAAESGRDPLLKGFPFLVEYMNIHAQLKKKAEIVEENNSNSIRGGKRTQRRGRGIRAKKTKRRQRKN